MRPSLACGLAPLLLAGFACTAAWPDDTGSPLNFREYAGTLFVAGGIGEEELAAMAQVGEDFNLKLMFAEKSGDWLADIDVSVLAADGKKVLEARSNGPWLLARLPAGNYRVQATHTGQAIEKRTAVSASARRTLVFYW